MRLTVDELKHEVFGPVFDYIAKLIDDQLQDLQRPVDGIFLVGGLGCSQYLYDVLSERFGARVSKIVMVPRADVAVARGALHMTCAQDIISSKIIQRTYGLCTSMLFDPALDPEDSAVITKDGVKRCMTRFDVIAFKGDRISPSGGVSRHFWVTYPKHTEGRFLFASYFTYWMLTGLVQRLYMHMMEKEKHRGILPIQISKRSLGSRSVCHIWRMYDPAIK